MREILKRIGVQEVSVVKEQELPDGNFTTCPFPNPEIAEALALGLEQAKREKADLLLATDRTVTVLELRFRTAMNSAW